MEIVDNSVKKGEVQEADLSHHKAGYFASSNLSETKVWAEYAADYDAQVFSVSSYPQRRAQILQHIPTGKVLNMGCGSSPHLNVDLLKMGCTVVGSDFCPEMIEHAEKNCSDPEIQFQVADSRSLPFADGDFDALVTVNSMIPPERADVSAMFNEAFRVLKQGGQFVGVFPAFDFSLLCRDQLGMRDLVLDEDDLREQDTSGWQCYHTKESLTAEMNLLGVRDYKLELMTFNDEQEFVDFERLYGIDFRKLPVFHHMLIARK